MTIDITKYATTEEFAQTKYGKSNKLSRQQVRQLFMADRLEGVRIGRNIHILKGAKIKPSTKKMGHPLGVKNKKCRAKK